MSPATENKPPSANARGPAHVLVVDDNSLNRLKMRKAVEHIGHHVDVARNGAEAITMLRERPYDAVLLDIMMPEVDGFEVLGMLKSDDILREIPVIIISALDDETDKVVQGIELGAEDFLPKDFDPVVLSARLNACLSRKWFRDRELEYLERVKKLTQAAGILEAGSFTPGDLKLDDLAEKADALGRLAIVFRGLAQEIYNRERRLDRSARTLRGALHVLIAGVIFGIAPALGRMAAGADGYSPLSIVIWANTVSAVLCIAIAAARGGRLRPTLKDMGFLGLWAITIGCLYQFLTVLIAGHVEASTIALLGSSRAFVVFTIAVIIGLEKPSLRRTCGLGAGFAGVAAVIIFAGAGAHDDSLHWSIAALALPLLLAFHTLLMARRPTHLDPFATVGLMMVVSVVPLGATAAGSGEFYWPQPALGTIEIVILVLGAATAIALALALDLVRLTGAVFASQLAYSQTLAGILWAMLLLGETLSPEAWGALALVMVGVWLAEPRSAREEFRARIQVSKPSKSTVGDHGG
ncbi:response regulator [Defluviimonas sp. WL0024]|uniref:Response regulator n=1 Tax=Albidovulum salinarum TaxID=2984153 RepID=A0ABT2WYL9_9RHOB|nr:response regulator [Defluviimonas sp. WL0024]MCU9846779.1 response regulator [Defluviimonas sp. WL0024]